MRGCFDSSEGGYETTVGTIATVMQGYDNCSPLFVIFLSLLPAYISTSNVYYNNANNK